MGKREPGQEAATAASWRELSAPRRIWIPWGRRQRCQENGSILEIRPCGISERTLGVQWPGWNSDSVARTTLGLSFFVCEMGIIMKMNFH